MENYDIFLVEGDIDLERDGYVYTGYHIQFTKDGVKWMGEILEESDGYCVEWFNGGDSPENYERIDELVNSDFNSIQQGIIH